MRPKTLLTSTTSKFSWVVPHWRRVGSSRVLCTQRTLIGHSFQKITSYPLKSMGVGIALFMLAKRVVLVNDVQ